MTRIVRLAGLVWIAALVGLAIAPAAASAAQETATNGGLTVQMTYTGSGAYGTKNVRLKIIRNGVVYLDQEVDPGCEFCSVPGGFGQRSSVHAVQLDASTDPEAVFDLYTGGAHCCFYSLIYRYDLGTDAYVGLRHDWFNAGFRFIDPEDDGLLEFLSRDDRFAYLFASYAGSQYPPQIWRFDAGEMIDVTRQYPGRVKKNAAMQRRKYRKRKGEGDVRAILAAFVADKCLLSDCAGGFKLVRKAKRQGFLKKGLGGLGGATGAEFVKRLRRVLDRFGYL